MNIAILEVLTIIVLFLAFLSLATAFILSREDFKKKGYKVHSIRRKELEDPEELRRSIIDRILNDK